MENNESEQRLIIAGAEIRSLKERIIGLNKKINDQAYEDYYRKPRSVENKCIKCIVENNNHLEFIRLEHEKKIKLLEIKNKELEQINNTMATVNKMYLKTCNMSIKENEQLKERFKGQIWTV